jgi:hypothetical protein
MEEPQNLLSVKEARHRGALFVCDGMEKQIQRDRRQSSHCLGVRGINMQCVEGYCWGG